MLSYYFCLLIFNNVTTDEGYIGHTFFVILCGQFLLLFVYIFIVIGDPIIRVGFDPINRFNPATVLCLSQAMTCISNATWRGLSLHSISGDER